MTDAQRQKISKARIGLKMPNYPVRKTQGGGHPKGSVSKKTNFGIPAYIRDETGKKVGNPEYWRIYQEKIRKPRRDVLKVKRAKSVEETD